MNTRLQRLSPEESPENDNLPSFEAEEEDLDTYVPEELAILALRNTVLFPGVVLPITVGREASISLVRDSFKGDKLVGVISQRDRTTDEPQQSDLYEVGTMAKILKRIRMPDNSISIIIQGINRFSVKEFTQTSPYFKARVEILDEEEEGKNDVEHRAVMHTIVESAREIVNLSPNIPNEAIETVENIESLASLSTSLPPPAN